GSKRFGEPLRPEGERRRAQSSVIELGPPGPPDGLGELLGAAVALVEDPALPVAYDVACAAAAERRDPRAAREGLDRSNAEILLAGLHERRAAPVEVAELLGPAARHEGYGGIRRGAEARLLGSAPDEDEAPGKPPGGGDGHVPALVRDERSDPEQEVLAGRRC